MASAAESPGAGSTGSQSPGAGSTSSPTAASPSSPPPPPPPAAHPLARSWSLLHNRRRGKPQGAGDQLWQASFTEMCVVSSVESLWAAWPHVPPPSTLNINSNLAVFHEGRLPAWEDPVNARGGCWTLPLPAVRRSGPTASHALDTAWLSAVLGAAGGSLDDGVGHVLGVVASIRKTASRVAVWTADAHAADAVLEIGARLRVLWCLGDDDPPLSYQAHDSSASAGSTYAGGALYEI